MCSANHSSRSLVWRRRPARDIRGVPVGSARAPSHRQDAGVPWPSPPPEVTSDPFRSRSPPPLPWPCASGGSPSASADPPATRGDRGGPGFPGAPPRAPLHPRGEGPTPRPLRRRGHPATTAGMTRRWSTNLRGRWREKDLSTHVMNHIRLSYIHSRRETSPLALDSEPRRDV